MTDPQKIKKHSQIVQQKAKGVVVVGERVKTETGFRIAGHISRGFETYYEVMLPGTASALVLHPKKDRVARIIAGTGFVILDDGTTPAVDRKIQAGDEVVLKAGISYRFATASQDSIEMQVTQDSKYESRLEIIQEASSIADITDGQLKSAVRIENTESIVRRGSKARQQQAAAAGTHNPSQQVVALADDSEPEAAAAVATQAPIMNARPSMGRFDESGAG